MKNHRLSVLTGVTAIGLLCVLNCGSDRGNTTSLAKAPLLSGRLLKPDGKTPAKGAIVTILPTSEIAVITGNSLNKKTVPVTIITDRSGAFSVKSLDAGSYILEGTDNEGNAVRSKVITIADTASNVSMSDDTLEKTGAIRGAIRLDNGGDPQNIFILAFGSDRFAQVREDGSFLFDHLAKGVYDLKIVCLIDGYVSRDTGSIVVTSGDTCAIDTMTLAMQELCIPQNVTLTYDTIMQQVKLQWTMCNSAGICGYHIYRRDKDSSDTYDKAPLNGDSVVRQGTYVDTGTQQRHSYEYRISAVARSGAIGKKSRIVEVGTVDYFNDIDTINPPANLANKFLLDVNTNSRNEIIAAYSDSSHVSIVWYREDYSIRKTVTVDFTTNERWEGGCRIDNADNIYLFNVIKQNEDKVSIFDAAGKLQFKYSDSLSGVFWCDLVNDTLHICRLAGFQGIVLKMRAMGVFDTVDRFSAVVSNLNNEYRWMFEESAGQFGLDGIRFGLFFWRKYRYPLLAIDPQYYCYWQHSFKVINFQGNTIIRQPLSLGGSFAYFRDKGRFAFISNHRIVAGYGKQGEGEGLFVLNRK